ncbi:uncharacterized protein LOC114845724 isoform X2 [Betta splendens]|uniref:Uncharacterized protein LOC114845724 isoform X2 n=1 Tax=Betta splendens TaxID=158456 RepID=A0A6P7L5V7_BETSP|nr:uncharacterized protein LOC114845724 isoform X2 [Betta splendens]
MSNHSTAAPALNTSTILIVDAATVNASTSGAAPTLPPEIAANDITSRANYFYSFLASLGFVAGCFLLYSFIQTYRAQRRLAWLECLLWVFCSFQLLLLLLSLHIVAYRPSYMETTGLGCAVLSFFINMASLCGLLVLVLMAYVLTFDPPSHALLRKPRVCGPLVVLSSFLTCLLLAGLRGTGRGAQHDHICIMDPVRVSYAATKMCLVFLAPYSLQTGLLIVGCARQWKSKGRFLSGSEEGPMFLTVTGAMFCCLLFYNVVLLRGVQGQTTGERSPMERALHTVAELVLFSGSSVSLLLVLAIRRPCRDSLVQVFRQLRDCCQRPGRPQQNRNIIAPHIEIVDTLQDIEKDSSDGY